MPRKNIPKPEAQSEKPKMGRPSIYSEQLASDICQRLMTGDSLVKICSDPEMPGRSTVFEWLTKHRAFADMYTCAHEVQADIMAEEILEIADTVVPGERRTKKADGSVEVVTGDMVERARLRVDTRMWLMAKLAPRKYNDRTAVEHDVGPGLADLLKEVERREAQGPMGRLPATIEESELRKLH